MKQHTNPSEKNQVTDPKSTKRHDKTPPGHHGVNYIVYSSSVFASSTAICLLNLYNIFSVLFWISSDGLPDDIFLLIEIVIEFLLICEITIRLGYKLFLRQLYDNIKLYHKRQNDTVIYLLILWVSSFPQQVVYSILIKHNPNLNADSMSYFLVLKLIRSIPEVYRYTAKLEELLFYKTTKTLIFMKCIENVGLIILITHFATSLFMLIQKLNPDIDKTPYEREFNPYGTDTSYFARKGLTKASHTTKYVDALYFSVSTMTACSFGDVTPRSFAEIVTSLFVLVLGASVLAKVFADFASLNYLLNLEKTITANKFEQVQKFCKINKIPQDIWNKILDYFKIDPDIADPVNKHFLQTTLPQSLQCELNVHLNKDFIEKSNLFNFSSPEFIISLSKKLRPMVSMQGDYICRVGEIADEMYFIQSGEVDIYATDGLTKIAVLKEGSFFGEIGLIQKTKRTVYVRAKSLVVLQVLKKNDFDDLSQVFHSEFNYLKKVAHQRSQICHPEDIGLHRHSHKNRISFHSKLERALSNCQEIAKSEPMNKKTALTDAIPEKIPERVTSNFWGTLRGLLKENRQKDSFWAKITFRSVINPQLTFYRSWTALMILTLVYNLIYIPYSISFEYQAQEGDLFPVDIISIVIFFLDIIVQCNTARPRGDKFETNPKKVRQEYFKQDFVIDLICVFPFDYIAAELSVPYAYSAWIRLTRLVKLKKVSTMLSIVKRENLFGSGRLGSLIIAFLFLNHWYACILYLLAKRDHSDNPEYNLFLYADTVTKDKIPLWDQEHYLKYFAFVYWALQISTGGSSMDVLPITVYEKIVQCVGLLFFKVYFAFVGAEVTSIVIAVKIAFTENADKNEAYNKWMENMKLLPTIQDRVRNFNQLKWDKFKGLDENQILTYLPATLRDEVREFMLRDMIEHIDIFSSVDKGFVSSFIKRLRFQILCEGEFVFRKGDIAEDIFFIFEGNVAVMDLEEEKAIATLKKSDMFGEMGVIQLSAGTRSRSIKAASNVSLAVMSQDDLRDICEQFPEVQKKILQKIEDRKLQNQKKEKPKEEVPKIEVPAIEGSFKTSLSSNHANGPDAKSPDNMTEETKPETKNFEKEREIKLINTLLKPKTVIPKKIEIKDSKLEESGMNLLQDCSIITEEKTIDDDKGTILPDESTIDKRLPKINGESNVIIDPNSSILPTDVSKDLLIKDTPTFSGKPLQEALNDVKKPKVTINLDPKLDEAPKKKDTSSSSDSSTKASEPKIQSETSLPLPQENSQKKLLVQIKKIKRTVKLIKFISLLGKRKAVRKFVELFMRTRGFTLSIISLYNITFLPLYIGLQTIQFKGVFLALEIISIIFYGLDAIIKVVRYFVEDFYREKIDDQQLETMTIEELKQGRKKRSKIWFLLGLLLSVLYAIPFSLIFEYAHNHSRFLNLGLVLLQLVRLFGFDQLLWVFTLNFFKIRIGLANILTSVLVFTLFNHFAGCFHMYVGYTIAHHDIEETWLTKLPAPQPEWPHNEIEHYVSDAKTLYISALYWAYATTMNLGVGDIISVGLYEKVWCAIVMIIAAFLFVFLFGNLVSLVDDIVPQYQKNYEESFRHVLEYTKEGEYQKFSEKINKYYDYIWVSNKGFEEITLLKELPNLLKVDIQMDRYGKTIHESRFFRDKNGTINTSIVRYFFKRCQYLIAMTDDIIINEGQETEDVYFILDGEIVGFDHEADTMKRLKVGGYFGGYIPAMVQFYEFKATTISKLAVMKGKNFKFLCEAYPDWIENVRMMNAAYRSVVGLQRKIREFLKLKKERAGRKNTLENEIDTIEKAIPTEPKEEEKKPEEKKEEKPNVDKEPPKTSLSVPTNRTSSKNNRKTMKFFSVLFNKEAKNLLKVKRLFLKPNSRIRVAIEAVHFIIIVYSAFALPVIVGFELTLSGFSLVMEYLIFFEAIFYSIAQLRTGQYEAGILTVDFKTILKSYIKRGFYNEIIAFIPFNLIFFWAEVHHPVLLISILKLNRLVLLTRISGIVAIFCSMNPKILKILALGKPIFLLSFIWHFTSLSWMWYNLIEKEEEIENYWFGALELGRKSIFQQYIYCMHFLMNIATTTGYPEPIAYNNEERVIYIIYVNVGIGLFALAFGMMVESSKALPEKYQEIFELVCQLENMLAKRNAGALKKKLELYYSYIVENETKSLSRFEDHDLPTNLLRDFTHEQSRLIMHHPMFEFVDSRSFYIELFGQIDHQLYMPGDYIIQKGDYGLGIYFLVSGNVLCYSANERIVLLNLTEGDWFGEKSLLSLTKNTQTFVAETFCTCFYLSKANFDKILIQFPHISNVIYTKLQERHELLKPDDKMIKDLELISHDKAKSLRSSEEREEFQRVLLAMEVPIHDDDGSKSPRTIKKKVRDALNLRKIQLLNGPVLDINDYEDPEEDRIDDEYVAEDEFSDLHDDFKKISLRNRGQEHQRRFSRIVIGSEKSLSKTGGFKIKWGINLN